MTTSRDIIRKLRKEDWMEVGVKGSHHQFKHPVIKGKVTVPHPKKQLTRGTLNSIRKQAGWK